MMLREMYRYNRNIDLGAMQFDGWFPAKPVAGRDLSRSIGRVRQRD
jgi:hypothetical protein